MRLHLTDVPCIGVAHRCFIILFTILVASHYGRADDRIYPTNLEYLGAFRVPPESSNDSNWSFGGYGLTWHAKGDPRGARDGYPGSLFSIGKPGETMRVSEFSIPVPRKAVSRQVDDLPVANTLQAFADITGGLQKGGQTGTTLHDVQVMPSVEKTEADRLYWAMYIYYMPTEDAPLLGQATLSLRDPQPQGPWRLAERPGAVVGYLLNIPSAWADRHVAGRSLGVGRFRLVNAGSWGPSLYACAPWQEGEALPANHRLKNVKLLHYDEKNMMESFGNADDWADGTWIYHNERSALVFAGCRGRRNLKNGWQYYGPPGPFGQGDKGYHAEPYYKCLAFYDPHELAAVARGKLPSSAPQPYAIMNLSRYMIQPADRAGLGGCTFDAQHQLMYVIEREADGETTRFPIVHVFRVHDQQIAPIPPLVNTPTNVATSDVGSDHISLKWNAGSVNSQEAAYLVYRDELPVALVVDRSFRDDHVSPGTTYQYGIVAVDDLNRESPPSTPLVVTTSPGTDTTPPQFYRVEVRQVTATGVVVRWRTDEPSRTRLQYGIMYRPPVKHYETPTLTTEHEVKLEGLEPDSTYEFTPQGIDASGNAAECGNAELYWRTASAVRKGNRLPSIAKSHQLVAKVGQTIEIEFVAADADNSYLYFEILEQPPGSRFNPRLYNQSQRAAFGWTPRADQTGTHVVRYSVSDGSSPQVGQVTIEVR